ncbi:MAG: hypothetical protein RIQ47_416 [Bacteroidota bacterium]
MVIKYTCRLLLASFIFLYLFSSGQKSTYKVGVIAFYNLENLYDTINDPNKSDEEFLPDGTKHYSGEVYFDKLGKLADVLSQIGTEKTPDGWSVLGCAEIENEQVLRDLVAHEKLRDRKLEIVHFNSPDDRGVDVGLIYNPKYFTPVVKESLNVPLKNSDGSNRRTRDILYVAGTYDGEPMHFFVNHWPSRRGGEEASAPGRSMAAGICRAKIDSIIRTNPDAKIVLMGDLNDDPVSPSVAKVLGAKGKKEDVGRSGMFNPWMEPYKNGIGTLAYNDSWNLFDQIIISGGFLNKDNGGFFYHSAHIFHKPWMEQTTGRYRGYPKRTFDFDKYIGGYSDHFPTYIEFLEEIKSK